MDEKLLAPSRIADYHYHFQKAGVVDALDVSHQVRSLTQFFSVCMKKMVESQGEDSILFHTLQQLPHLGLRPLLVFCS